MFCRLWLAAHRVVMCHERLAEISIFLSSHLSLFLSFTVSLFSSDQSIDNSTANVSRVWKEAVDYSYDFIVACIICVDVQATLTQGTRFYERASFHSAAVTRHTGGEKKVNRCFRCTLWWARCWAMRSYFRNQLTGYRKKKKGGNSIALTQETEYWREKKSASKWHKRKKRK